MTHARPSPSLLLSLAGALAAVPLSAQSSAARMIQTNAAGDNVHVIDPATNPVVGVIEGITIPHGVTPAPDGSALYISTSRWRPSTSFRPRRSA